MWRAPPKKQALCAHSEIRSLPIASSFLLRPRKSVLLASQTVTGEKVLVRRAKKIQLATKFAVASQNVISKKVCRSKEHPAAKTTELPTRCVLPTSQSAISEKSLCCRRLPG
jgi:hypothetical protein